MRAATAAVTVVVLSIRYVPVKEVYGVAHASSGAPTVRRGEGECCRVQHERVHEGRHDGENDRENAQHFPEISESGRIRRWGMRFPRKPGPLHGCPCEPSRRFTVS